MRLSRNRWASTLGFNMTSMIDIVFLLIIFFMAVSQFNRSQDSQLTLAEIQAGGITVESSFILDIDSQQRLWIGGKMVSLPQLIQRLTQEIETSGGDPSRFVVRIRCDRNQDSVRLNEVMNQLAGIGVVDIQLAVNKK